MLVKNQTKRVSSSESHEILESLEKLTDTAKINYKVI